MGLIFVNYISDKGLIFGKYKNLLYNSTIKTNNPWGKKMDQAFD